jgi:CcmD family protein
MAVNDTGWLIWAGIVIWLGTGLYVVGLAARQRRLERRLSMLEAERGSGHDA